MCDFFVYIKKKQYLCTRVRQNLTHDNKLTRTRESELRGGMAASQTRSASFFLQAHSDDGMWRSPVAQRSGGPEVASSNLVIPTKRITTSDMRWLFFLSMK